MLHLFGMTAKRGEVTQLYNRDLATRGVSGLKYTLVVSLQKAGWIKCTVGAHDKRDRWAQVHNRSLATRGVRAEVHRPHCKRGEWAQVYS